MIIDEERKKKIWDELINTQRLETDILPHERTKKMLMEEYNLTGDQVEGFIRKMLQKGLLTKRVTVLNGKSCVVYSTVEK